MGLHPMIDSILASSEAPGAGLEPETVLPEQFFRRSAAASPERCLMLAVLEAALLDLRRSANRRTARMRRLADEVEGWFAADDDGWPCSFLSICHALGLDAAAVRTRLARGRTEVRAQIITLPMPGTDAETPAPDRARRFAAAG
jgi:hypothetical protein